jgi:uncharacterized protein (DUF362 family)
MSDSSKLTRRNLLKAAAAGAGAGLIVPSASASVVSNYPANKWGTPGLYPASVVKIQHAGSTVNSVYQTGPIQQMIRTGLMQLTGAANYVTGWRQFVGPGDVVGIKINPNGNAGTISSPAVIMEIIAGLMLAGVEQGNIIVYERYQAILDRTAGWFPAWVKTMSASPAYSDRQIDIAGYDPNHYADLPLFLSWQDPANPSHRRSYAAQFISSRVNKVINLACLKHHNASGVTLALKNLSHGCTNNVNRSHDNPAQASPRQFSYTTFIPAVLSMNVIRYKAVLHIIDGIHGLWDFGPNSGSNAYNWEHKSMYFATDAVAIDRVGWKAIDAQRESVGLPGVADSKTNPLAPCQPQYIDTAAAAGLGENRDDHIHLRTTVLV